MSIIKNITPQYDFWEMYPELELVEEFKNIKIKFKKQSSDVMWFIVLGFDLNSKFHSLFLDERMSLLSKDVMKDIKFYKTNISILQPAIDMFIDLNDTVAQRQLREWEDVMEKRRKFIKSQDYDLDNFEKLDKMAANTLNLMNQLSKIKEQLSQEKDVITRGGAQPSLADNGEI